MTDSDEVKLLPCDAVLANATRAICARNSGGYCEFIGHDGLGCMVGWGEAPEAANCKMTDAALCLTAEYEMARAALATRPPVVIDEVVERVARVLARSDGIPDHAPVGDYLRNARDLFAAIPSLASMPAVVSGGQT